MGSSDTGHTSQKNKFCRQDPFHSPCYPSSLPACFWPLAPPQWTTSAQAEAIPFRRTNMPPTLADFSCSSAENSNQKKQNPCCTKDQANPRKLATNLDRDQIRGHTSHQKSMPKKIRKPKRK